MTKAKIEIVRKFEFCLCCGGVAAGRLREELLKESSDLCDVLSAALLDVRLVFVGVGPRGPLVDGRGHLDTGWSVFSWDTLCLVRSWKPERKYLNYISCSNRFLKSVRLCYYFNFVISFLYFLKTRTHIYLFFLEKYECVCECNKKYDNILILKDGN